jgi:hypothetical protein
MGNAGGTSSAAAGKGVRRPRRARPECPPPWPMFEWSVPSSNRREKEMRTPEPNRREFTKLAAAAMGGLLAGLGAGCAAED